MIMRIAGMNPRAIVGAPPQGTEDSKFPFWIRGLDDRNGAFGADEPVRDGRNFPMHSRERSGARRGFSTPHRSFGSVVRGVLKHTLHDAFDAERECTAS